MSEKKTGGAGSRAGKTSGRGQRDLRVRVKTAKGRKLSSKLWLERQLNDPYVVRARREGFRGRAAYKILELDDKYRFLLPGARVVDLGCAPGGWCQVAVARVNALGEKSGKAVGKVLGVDLKAKRAVMSLLAIEFEPATEPPEGYVTLHLAGGGAIRLHVECIEGELRDLGSAWETVRRPEHADGTPGDEPAKT